MADETLEALVAVVPPLMQSLEALGQVSQIGRASCRERV